MGEAQDLLRGETQSEWEIGFAEKKNREKRTERRSLSKVPAGEENFPWIKNTLDSAALGGLWKSQRKLV